MKEHPDLWIELMDSLRNAWPQISGSLLAIMICYGRLLYDGVERKKRWIEPFLCGALSWGFSSALELVGIPSSMSPALGGAVGFIGVEKLREIAIRIIDKRLDEKSHD
ncbi:MULTISPECIES: phage holin, lambda family [Xenorhabdus]|uniref:phage holin, lambda family n=1 Tax=Xenorhabdus TaxID=626 RepID=UPI000646761A|nr:MULTISPECIES: phage holin, lambda family [Xenorhabdus]MBC8943890.1 holin [Xenorhabdus indica]